jgi:hypothetical protein
VKTADPHVLATLAEDLSELRDSKAWETLRNIASENEEKFAKHLASAILHGLEIDREDLIYKRGVIRGMNYLLNKPGDIAAKFEKMFEEAEYGSDGS